MTTMLGVDLRATRLDLAEIGFVDVVHGREVVHAAHVGIPALALRMVISMRQKVPLQKLRAGCSLAYLARNTPTSTTRSSEEPAASKTDRKLRIHWWV